MQTEYTLADLTRITGAKRRSVQLWAEAGVIQADSGTERAGTGTHRRFSRDEAIICCIIAQLARMQITIGRLKGIADGLRSTLQGGDKLAARREDVEQAINGDEPVYLVVGVNFDQSVYFNVISPLSFPKKSSTEAKVAAWRSGMRERMHGIFDDEEDTEAASEAAAILIHENEEKMAVHLLATFLHHLERHHPGAFNITMRLNNVLKVLR